MKFLAFVLPQSQDDLTSYIRILSIHNTQCSILLKSSDTAFKQSITTEPTKSSLTLFLISFITLYGTNDVTLVVDEWIGGLAEDGSWATEYVHGLLEEIRGKCFRIVLRILSQGLTMQRLFSVPLIIQTCKSFGWRSNENLFESHYFSKLPKSTQSKAFEQVMMALIKETNVQGGDLHLMLWICKCVGCRFGLELFIGVVNVSKEFMDLVLEFGKLCLEAEEFATLSAFATPSHNVSKQSGGVDLAIGTLLEMFPDFSADQCRALLAKHNGNLELAVQSTCAPRKPIDEFKYIISLSLHN